MFVYNRSSELELMPNLLFSQVGVVLTMKKECDQSYVIPSH